MPLTNYLTINQRVTLYNLLVAIGKESSINYGESSNMLNAPVMVPNGPAPQVPKTLDFDEITETLQPATVAKLSGDGLMSAFKLAVDGQDRAKVDQIVTFWTKGSVLTSEELATLGSLTSATMPDPGWPAYVSGPSLFKQAFPGLTVVIDGSSYTEQCHPLLCKEAKGDVS